MKSVKEVSDFFHVHFRTVYAWIKSGKVKSIKVGHKHMISDEEFDRIKNNGVNLG